MDFPPKDYDNYVILVLIATNRVHYFILQEFGRYIIGDI